MPLFDGMIMDIISETIAGRACRFVDRAAPLTVVWAGGGQDENHLTELAARCPNINLFSFDYTGWDADFSPWPATLGGGRVFDGHAERTLSFLLNDALPWLDGHSSSPRMLCAYSLAGLFSMWCAGQTDAFSAYVCCSSSFWYPGWADYAKTMRFPGKPYIYISLGGKEKNTKDPLMATIEDETRRQAALCKASPDVREVMFRMVPGGHFASDINRLGDGIDWAGKALHVL